MIIPKEIFISFDSSGDDESFEILYDTIYHNHCPNMLMDCYISLLKDNDNYITKGLLNATRGLIIKDINIVVNNDLKFYCDNNRTYVFVIDKRYFNKLDDLKSFESLRREVMISAKSMVAGVTLIEKLMNVKFYKEAKKNSNLFLYDLTKNNIAIDADSVDKVINILNNFSGDYTEDNHRILSVELDDSKRTLTGNNEPVYYKLLKALFNQKDLRVKIQINFNDVSEFIAHYSKIKKYFRDNIISFNITKFKIGGTSIDIERLNALLKINKVYKINFDSISMYSVDSSIAGIDIIANNSNFFRYALEHNNIFVLPSKEYVNKIINNFDKYESIIGNDIHNYWFFNWGCKGKNKNDLLLPPVKKFTGYLPGYYINSIVEYYLDYTSNGGSVNDDEVSGILSSFASNDYCKDTVLNIHNLIKLWALAFDKSNIDITTGVIRLLSLSTAESKAVINDIFDYLIISDSKINIIYPDEESVYEESILMYILKADKLGRNYLQFLRSDLIEKLLKMVEDTKDIELLLSISSDVLG